MIETFKTKYLDIFISGINPENVESTREKKRRDIAHFLDYLVDLKIETFDNLDINVIYDFVNSLDYMASTIGHIKYSLKEFFDILYKKEITDFDGKTVFPVISVPRRESIPSFYETEEVKKMTDALTPESRYYIRNKTMVLLAAQLGLRASDILQLKLTDIKWDKNIIEKKQAKTGNTVSVPLPENIKLLLIEYLKNHRPETDSDYVFINEKTGRIYTYTTLAYIIRTLIRKTDIVVGKRKIGPHALRHSLATRLLKNNTPMPVITGVLGHKNLYMTRTYLSIDIDSLRQMSLEIES